MGEGSKWRSDLKKYSCHFLFIPSLALTVGCEMVIRAADPKSQRLEVALSSNLFSYPLNSSVHSGPAVVLEGALVSCSINPSPPSGLLLDSTDCHLYGTPNAVSPLSPYSIIVTGSSSTKTFPIQLEVTNIPPVLQFSAPNYNFNLNTFGTSGMPANLGGAVSSCSIDHALPAGLNFNSIDCSISGTATSPVGASAYVITASNAAGASSPVTLQIGVLNAAPNLSYSSSNYDFALLSASSTGTPTNSGGLITSCNVTPALPAGLSISATTCQISGTPNAVSAAASYSITPSNAVGSGSTVVLSLGVHNVVPSIGYSAGSYTFNFNDSSSSSGVPTNSGGTITGCSVTPALPAGLSLSTSTCAISGTPTSVTAAQNYTITPSNSVGSGPTVTLPITIANTAPNIAYSSGSYDFPLNTSSSTGAPSNSGGAITGCAVSPALPAGLSIAPTTCVISGTASIVSASQNYTITPSNLVGSGPAQIISLQVHNVIPAITFSASSYSFSYNAASDTGVPTNSGGAITGCIVSPALPAGLSISTTTCQISGTPSVVAANATYTVTPSNAVGNGAAVTIDIAVANTVPSITYTGSPYDFALNASSSTGNPSNSGGAITGCSVSPTLPSGLSISSTTCAISGTPSVVASDAIYSVTPSNAVGSGPVQTIHLQVHNVVPNITYSGSPFIFVQNVSSSSGTPSNSGGAITGCSSTPALPPGLTLNTASCLISGTPTTPTATSNYTITSSNGAGSGSGVAVNITVNGPVDGALSGVTNIACAGSSTGSVAVTGNNGLPFVTAGPTYEYQYQIDGGAFTQGVSATFTGLAAGAHSIVVKDALGATKTLSVTLTEASSPDVAFSSQVTSNTITNGQTVTMLFSVSEIAGKNATPAKIRIYSQSGYTLNFDSAATSTSAFAPFTPIAVDNTKWLLTTSNGVYNEYSRTGTGGGNAISCNEQIYVMFTFTRSTPSNGLFTITTQFRTATGETNTSNNSSSISFTAQ